MNPEESAVGAEADGEIAALIETLLATEQRLEELTGGEVDTVASRDGRTFLLRRAQEQFRFREAAKQTALLNEMRVLFDMVPAMIWFKNTENGFLRVNRRAAEITGMPVAEIEGRSAFELFPEEAAGYYADDLEVIRSGAPKLGIIEKLRGAGGRELWVQTDKVPVCDEQGKVTGLIALVQDITERKQAEEDLQWKTAFLEAQLNSSPHAILVVDDHGQKVFQNRHLASLFNIPAAIAVEKDDAAQIQWVANSVKDSEQFTKKVAFLYAHPDQISRDEIELKDGAVLDRYSAPVIGTDGKYYGRLWTFRDITAGKRAEAALLESKLFLRSTLDALSAHIAILDEQGVIVEVNAAWNRYARENGFQGERSVGVNYLKVCEAITAQRTAEATLAASGIRAVMSGQQEEFLLEYPCPGPEGKRWFMLRVTRFAGGGPVRVVVAHEDITEQKRAEDALRENEERFRGLFTATATGIATATPEGRFLQANAAYCQMLGYTEEELGTRDFASLTHPEDRHLNSKLRDELLAGIRDSYVKEKRYLKKNGEIVWTLQSVSASRAASGEIKILIVVAENITARKQAEERLAANEILLRQFVQHTPAAVAMLDTEMRYIQASERWLQDYHLAGREIIGHSHYEVFPDMPEHWKGIHRRVLAGAVERCDEAAFPRADGTIEWLEWEVRPWLKVGGAVGGVIMFTQVITKRKRIEARFRRLVDSNVQGVIFWNTKGEITGANDYFLKLVQHTRADLAAGRINWVTLTPPEFAELDQRAIKEIAATGVCAPYEKEFIRQDGARVPILLGSAMFEDNPDEGVCFVLDLTERKKLEHQFRQAQKMDGIGQLAGGVAHDFNNILAVILMQAGLLKMEGELSPRQLEFASEIEKSAERAANLTRQLLLFSRKQALQPRELDLNDMVANITRMLHRIIGEDVQMQFKYSPQPLFIHADAGMVDQVLMNLTVNARDAMPNGGRLFIETSAVNLDALAASQFAHGRPGSFVCLSVSDTGSGIPPEVMPQIFEPFFTTKDIGKGTGLGLATVFGIVQQHHGWIQVYSVVGQGTSFKVYLPRLAKTTGQKSTPEGLPPAVGGSETILLVEDDPSLCACVNSTLSRLGYRILEARSGASALDVWNQHRAEIRLLLTDIVMPGGMNGKELAQLLLKQQPQLKVIYASGYAAGIMDKDFSLQEGVNFLTKPYETHKLAQTVRSCLDAPE